MSTVDCAAAQRSEEPGPLTVDSMSAPDLVVPELLVLSHSFNGAWVSGPGSPGLPTGYSSCANHGSH